MRKELRNALAKYNARTQFHDAKLLDEVIRAVREEERELFKDLHDLSREIVRATNKHHSPEERL
jgi:hypothetical protein